MQVLYGYFNESYESVGKGEKELLLSIERFYELFLYQTLFLIEVLETAKRQIIDSSQKHRPSEQELNPNHRFTDNILLNSISDNSVLKTHFEKKHVSWVGENEIVRKLFSKFKNSPEYLKYMSSDVNNFEKDKEIILIILKKYIAEFPLLLEFYEERSIFWADDIDIVNYILIKIITSCKNDTVAKSFNDLRFFIGDDENDFVVNLFRKTIINSEKYEKIISEKTFNWEVDRIAVTDILLMKMAVCELLEFPSIPVKVTLNEYIDLSKMYSTPKSNIFINGILDKLISDFKNTGMIKKTGRGLM